MMPADAKSITQELNKICEAWAVADGRAGSNLIDASDRLTHLEIYATDFDDFCTVRKPRF